MTSSSGQSDATTLVIRTRPGTILGAATHADVTFEVDEIDREIRTAGAPRAYL